MRYNVHPPRAFRNRIAKSIGVLVAAALIATLGLPSAVQAQTPAAPMVTGTGDGMVGSDPATITATWGQPLGQNSDQDQWLLEYTEPDVAWDDATKVMIDDATLTSDALPANDPRIHHGVWRFRVSYYDQDGGDDSDGAVIGMPSALTDYQHGPPASAPTSFAAHPAGPDARRLVWEKVTGADSYELRYSSDPTDDDEWEDWTAATSGEVIDELDMGTEYTFEVRALGASRAGVGDLHGPSASITEMTPMSSPTLPEIAALLLAMLLLGSGAYLLRGRQSGGLTPA
jgi:hypothetical protein